MGGKVKKQTKHFLIISVFAIAFALLESSVVVYLRRLFGFDPGYSPPKMEVILNLGLIAFLSPQSLILPDTFISKVELPIEVSTLVILIRYLYFLQRNLNNNLERF